MSMSMYHVHVPRQVGIALCAGMYDDRPTEVRVLIISRGSAFAITMVYGLTQLVAALGGAAELSGHTRRVAALLRGLQQVEHTTAEWRRHEAGARRRPSDDARPGGGRGGGGSGGAALLECRRLVVTPPPPSAARLTLTLTLHLALTPTLTLSLTLTR